MDPAEIEFFEQQEIIIINSLIAQGSYGEIFLVYSKRYQVNFALKKIPESKFNEKEINCLLSINQSNVINLYNYFKFNNFVYMLMDYCPSDLFNTIKSAPSLNNAQILRYAFEVVSAIKACHDMNIAHSDIKPSNFLIDKYGRLKICDFGLSQFYDNIHKSTSSSGTMLFMAPEQFRKKGYDPMKSDVWSIGVTLFYIATKTYPFFAITPQAFKNLVETGVYPVNAIVNEDLRRVIFKCLSVDPAKRPTVDEILEMDYFREYKASRSQSKPRRSSLKVISKVKSVNSSVPVLHHATHNPRISQVPATRRLSRIGSSSRF